MADNTVTDFTIYNEEFHTAVNEQLMQNANAFNAASGGTIMLSPEIMKGEFEKETFFKSMGSSFVARRDPTSTAGVADQKLNQGEHVAVKLNRRLGPVKATEDQFRKVGKDPREFSFALGEQAGQSIIVDYLNSAIAAAVAGISAAGTNDLVHDGTAGQLNHIALNSGLRKFGDRAGQVGMWIMHSKQYFDLVEQALTDKAYEIYGMAVREGTTATLGRPVLVVDSPALVYDNLGTDNYHAIGLTPGGIMVKESEGRVIRSQPVLGEENLGIRIQGEHAFNIGLSGLSYDATAGANPTDALLADSANWVQVASDVKSCAGVVVTTL
ncbi:MAG: major capsid protein [Spongiibacteraceae bacterium]